MSFVSLDELNAVEIVPGYSAKFLHTKQMTLANWEVRADALLPEHSHEHEQISIVSEGEFELTVDGIPQILRPGVVALIPPDAPHSGRALTDCKIIDIFHPVRDDYVGR